MAAARARPAPRASARRYSGQAINRRCQEMHPDWGRARSGPPLAREMQPGQRSTRPGPGGALRPSQAAGCTQHCTPPRAPPTPACRRGRRAAAGQPGPARRPTARCQCGRAQCGAAAAHGALPCRPASTAIAGAIEAARPAQRLRWGPPGPTVREATRLRGGGLLGCGRLLGGDSLLGRDGLLRHRLLGGAGLHLSGSLGHGC
jgi:hypothetical protein